MKKLFLSFLAAFSANAFCMEAGKTVYFNTIHEEGLRVVPVVSEGMKLDSVDGNEGFEVSLQGDCNSGVVSVYDSNDKSVALLQLRVTKERSCSPARVSFVEGVANGDFKAVLYRPSMGGGDSFVLAIGNEGSDIFSLERLQAQDPSGGLQQYTMVSETTGR